MSWYRQEADLLDDPRGVRLLALAGAAGVAALVAVRSWCARRQSETLPAEVARAEVRRLGVSAGKAAKLVGALVASGLLVSSSGDALALPEASTVRREDRSPLPAVASAESAAEETGKAARQRRWRASRKGKVDASTVDAPPSTDASTKRLQVRTDPSTQASTVDAPPSHTLPPRTGTSTITSNPPTPPAGGMGGGAAEESAPESAEQVAPEVQAKQAPYLGAYGAGVTSVTGEPWAAPTHKAESWAVGSMIKTYAANLRGAALLAWLTETAAAYTRATLDGAQYQRGFAPSKCLDWLKSGRPAARPRGGAGRAAPPQQLDPVGRMTRRWGKASPLDDENNWTDNGEWCGPAELCPEGTKMATKGAAE